MRIYLLTLFVLLLSCAEMTAQGLRAEIMIFSGRPNPVFTVTDPAEIRELLAIIKALPPRNAQLAKDDAPENSMLGYRGIAVENLSETTPELKSLVVSRNAVQITQDTTAIKPGAATTSAVASSANIERRIDTSSLLENRLLQLALKQKAIDPNLLVAINHQR